MDEFKKNLQSRLTLLTSALLFSCCTIMLSRHFEKETVASVRMQGFVEGFQMGIVTGLLCFLGIYIVRYILAVRNAKRLKKLYISETDERKLFIKQKSGSVGMKFCIFGLALGTAVSGNINDTIFFTLLASCLFVSLIHGFLKLYYHNKY